MNTSEAQIAFKSLNSQLASLNPSTLIYLYEIDIESVALDKGIPLTNDEKIFRFHNNLKLTNTSIYWQGNQYIAAPIMAEGFEVNSKGTLPTPKLSITVNDDGNHFLALLKTNINRLDDLVGSKVTRIRTFVSYIDSINFAPNEVPVNFSPNNNVMSKDIFYIDRKSKENKIQLEFELASIFDIEGISLPSRTILSNRCSFQYRGCGCLYEYEENRTDIHDDGTLPKEAPAIANQHDESILSILNISSITYRGAWKSNVTYNIGDAAFIEKDDVKYYFVAVLSNTGQRPPNSLYWIQDDCSRLSSGCRLRFGTNGAMVVGNSGLIKGNLPFGGFPSVSKVN